MNAVWTSAMFLILNVLHGSDYTLFHILQCPLPFSSAVLGLRDSPDLQRRVRIGACRSVRLVVISPMKSANWIVRLAPLAVMCGALAISPAEAAGAPFATSGTLTVVVQDAGNPDDIAVAPDNTIYLRDFNAH